MGRNPNEVYSKEEKEAMADELIDRAMGPRTPADVHTMSQQWWQETAEELAAKVRGYFTNGDGRVEIPENLDGDWDLYQTASRLTTGVVRPGGGSRFGGGGMAKEEALKPGDVVTLKSSAEPKMTLERIESVSGNPVGHVVWFVNNFCYHESMSLEALEKVE